MEIKDLEIAKELSQQERAAVSGGFVLSGLLSAQGASATGIGNTAVNLGPIVTNVDASTKLDLGSDLNQIIGSVNALAAQA
jgi:hypothetical protein